MLLSCYVCVRLQTCQRRSGKVYLISQIVFWWLCHILFLLLLWWWWWCGHRSKFNGVSLCLVYSGRLLIWLHLHLIMIKLVVRDKPAMPLQSLQLFSLCLLCTQHITGLRCIAKIWWYVALRLSIMQSIFCDTTLCTTFFTFVHFLVPANNVVFAFFAITQSHDFCNFVSKNKKLNYDWLYAQQIDE